MRKIIVFSLLFSLFLGGFVSSVALAQEEDTQTMVGPGITPDSSFYFLDDFWKSVRLTFSFSQERKDQLRLDFAEEKLAEIKVMVEEKITEAESKGEAELKKAERALDKARERYQEQMEWVEERAKEREDLVERVAEATSRHLKVLEKVLEKTPEQAQKGIERAIEISERGHIRAIESLENRNMPQRALQLRAENIDQMRERVEEKIQERLNQPEDSGEQNQSMERERERIFCTTDVKECPDGSYVGRIGPNCEFAPCPSENFIPPQAQGEREQGNQGEDNNSENDNGDNNDSDNGDDDSFLDRIRRGR